ncbi:amidase [Acinetobacter shaoyimingii]|uniref:Amidase n=1 Tax=Acinetobacter shaoyimingii TaxID=2715164 RepID=A0A6G8RTU5_9GAMM|nr:amidase [Acinetobacter shaoyimingii]QIO05297.1 amidase [Acinetobacter shaoyimingii]
MASNQIRISAFTDDVLADHDAMGIAKLIASKEVSVQEVIEASVQRAKKVNPTLNAVALDCFEQAISQPSFINNRPFSGVPFFIKDNLDIAGLPTQHGAVAIKALPAKSTPQISQHLLDQGFQLMGKSKLPEFGLNASTEFADGSSTKNPWHTDYSCGASSGGSAALVASGVVPIAHANDGGGSIRIPAAACGLIGLKPSRGRTVDSDAARSLPINIISEGVLTRSVRDTAHFFAGMEISYSNPKLPMIGLIEGASNRKLRIGVMEQSIVGQVDAETLKTVRDTADLLQQLGHDVELYQLPIPTTFVDDFSHYWGFLSFLLKKTGRFTFNGEFDVTQLDHLTMGLANLYKKNFYKTPLFLYRLKRLVSVYRAVFQRYDVILTPVLAHTTPKLGYLSPELDFETLFDHLQHYVTFTPVQNVVGAPAISLPMGKTEIDALPIGVQISADIGDEKTLIELAYQIEAAKPWRRIQDEL